MVHRSGRAIGTKTYVALAADGLLAVVLGSKSLEGGLNDTTTQTEDEVESGLLNVCECPVSPTYPSQ
jgi:hypothetical protein